MRVLLQLRMSPMLKEWWRRCRLKEARRPTRCITSSKVQMGHTTGDEMMEATVASKGHLEELIEEATVDCYDEGEQATGLFTMLEENLALPFKTTVLGIEADVISVDMGEDGRLVAVCRAGKHRQAIALTELPLPSPPPAGAEWIAAYRLWAERRG